MIKCKGIVISLFTVLFSVLLLCTSPAPIDLSSPEQAYSTLLLTSKTFRNTDSSIVDSVGKPVGVTIAMSGGIFIDSLVLQITSRHSGVEGAVLDSIIIFRFNENDRRDTLHFDLFFSTTGSRYLELTTYKKLNYVSTVNAMVLVLGTNSSNTPPEFITDAPSYKNKFAAGDTVTIQVEASDYNNDDLKYGFVVLGKPLPRSETVVFSEKGGLFVWKSTPADTGVYIIQFRVSDNASQTEFRAVLMIGDVDYNFSPRITSTPTLTVPAGAPYWYQPQAIDEEDGELRWSLSGNLPENMAIDSMGGLVSWNPSPGVTTSGRVVLRVFDDGVPPAADSQELRITVTGINRPPVARSWIVATGQDQPLEILLVANDPEGDQLTYTIVKNPPFGKAVLHDSIVSYRPADAFKGSDTLLFIVSDSFLSSDTARVLIRVGQDNQKPVVVSRLVEIVEDIPTSILMYASDPEGRPLTYTVLSLPRFGILTGITEQRVYSPNANFSGVDTFTFVANDGLLESDPGVVFIKVIPVNDTPVAHDIGVPVAENSAVTIELMVTDPDDSVFTFDIIGQPLHGTLETVGTLEVRYVAAAGFTGNDTVLYTVRDEQGLQSDTARIIVAAGGSNVKPVATPQSVSVLEDSAFTIELSGTDPEGQPLQQYTIVKRPSHGALSNSGASLGYRPNLNFFGQDTLRFTVNDGLLDSDPANVIITVLPRNDVPVVSAQSYTTQLNTQLMIALTAKDVDDDVFTYKITAMPKYGVLDTSGLLNGYILYMPNNNNRQNDTIRYLAKDAAGGTSSDAPIVIFVLASNQRPIAIPLRVDINEDATAPIFLAGEDETPSQNLLYTITVLPKHGRFEGDFPAKSYKTDLNYNGPDTFWYKVSDGSLESEPARVVITVLPVNDPPTVSQITKSTDLGKLVDITLQATDPDDIVFTYKMIKGPAHGVADLSALGSGHIRYTPFNTPENVFKGLDTITYQAFDDETWASGIGYIVIAVALNNLPPTALPDTVTLKEDDSLLIVLDATDLDSDLLTYTNQSPVHGLLYNKTGKNIWYKPYANYNGTDAFQFTVSDGEFTSGPARVWIVVTPVNDVPVAESQTVTTELETPILISLTATDADGLTGLGFRVTKMPVHGVADTMNIKNRQITYTPAASFKGLDTLLFVARDAAGADSKVERIVVGVALNNQPPVATAQTYSGTEDVNVVITLEGSDIEGSPLVYIVDTVPKWGLLTGTGASRVYIPNHDVNGVDSFSYHVNDGSLGSAVVKVVITLAPVNDRPAAKDTLFNTLFEDSSAEINLPCSDVDGDPLTIDTVTKPQHGVLEILAGKKCRYTSNNNYFGADAFTFFATDGSGLHSDTVTVSLVIAAVNDAPVAVAPGTVVAVDEDGTVVIPLSGTDVDQGTVLQFAAAARSVHGSITAGNAEATYTPDRDFFGPDSFTFTASDGALTSNPAIVRILVKGVNDPPAISTIDDINVTVGETKGPISFTAADADGDVLMVSAASDNDAVTVAVGGTGNRTFTVKGESAGTALITITVDDGTATANAIATETFTVTVDAVVNKSPTITPLADITIDQDGSTGPIPFVVSDDDDPDLLTITPASDDVSLVPVSAIVFGGSGAYRTVTISPVAGAYGVANVTVTVSDGLTSVAETFSVTVNGQPVAKDIDTMLLLDGTLLIPIERLGEDPEDGKLVNVEQAPRSADPQYGTVIFRPSGIEYTQSSIIPIGVESPVEEFEYVGIDSRGLKSAPARVKIKINDIIIMQSN